jgi:hypothetical protein
LDLRSSRCAYKKASRRWLAAAVLVYELDRLGESGDLRNFSAGGNFAK